MIYSFEEYELDLRRYELRCAPRGTPWRYR